MRYAVVESLGCWQGDGWFAINEGNGLVPGLHHMSSFA